MKNIKSYIPLTAIAYCVMCATVTVMAQRPAENTMSSYYANKMLWNPALTGAEGNSIYALQNRSWIGFDGAPVLTNVSGQVAFGKNSALGLTYMHDKAGILIRSYGLLNYAYKVKLNENEYIRLGASFAFNSNRLNSAGSAGTDPVIINNVRNTNEFDGNLGIVYQRKGLALGITVNRIAENLNGKDQRSDLSLGSFGGRYGFKINKDEKLYMEPLVMLRFYTETSAIVDAGFLFRYNNMINVTGVYQTTGNIRTGIGIALEQLGEANLYYNTNHKISNHNSQQFEFGIGIYIVNKKKTSDNPTLPDSDL